MKDLIPNKKVLCFGEVLLRMSPQVNGGWIQECKIPAFIGGAELNVASALSAWEIPSKFFTALPDHALSHDIINYLQKKNIDTTSVIFSGDRIGIYFLPQGSDLKNAGVIYDRANSSLSQLTPGTIAWDEVLKEVSWLHFSAITPALSDNIRAVCLELLKIAASKNITVSLDLNYRNKLWKYGKDPVQVMPEITQYCDLIMGNIWAAESLLGIKMKKELIENGDKNGYTDHAEYTSEAIMKEFPKVKNVANTFRFDRESGRVEYFATINNKEKQFVSRPILATDITDKIGSGDCFMAGLIYGFYNSWEPEKIVNFSATAAIGKMYETSDCTNQSVERILLNTPKTVS